MEKREVQKLVKDFEGKLRDYNGWTFDFEHPGYFVYYQDEGDLAVYFTPDWNDRGRASIQINKAGDMVYSEEISYDLPLEASALFRIVRPYLDLLGAISK